MQPKTRPKKLLTKEGCRRIKWFGTELNALLPPTDCVGSRVTPISK
jgi:hypothetical protein